MAESKSAGSGLSSSYKASDANMEVLPLWFSWNNPSSFPKSPPAHTIHIYVRGLSFQDTTFWKTHSKHRMYPCPNGNFQRKRKAAAGSLYENNSNSYCWFLNANYSNQRTVDRRQFLSRKWRLTSKVSIKLRCFQINRI